MDLAPSTSHWGAFSAGFEAGGQLRVTAHPDDPAPSPLLGNLPSSLRHPTRVAAPAIRRGWLERGPGPDRARGDDEFVEVGWDEALDLLAAELRRVREEHGNQAIFGGSYGWASAGRFHHAQSQLHRFLNFFGGFTSARNSYSNGTSSVVLPHIVGSAEEVLRRGSSWPTIVANTDLLVAFGGVPEKNVFVTPGGVTRHHTPGYLRQLAERGTQVALISPLRADLPSTVDAEWYPIRPATDTALMLALAHTLAAEGLHDREFLERYSAGYEEFERYLFGVDWLDPHQWDLVINTGRANVDAALDMLTSYAQSVVRHPSEQDRLGSLQLASRIERALLADDTLGVDKLEVQFDNSTLVLQGEALAEEDRARAETIARTLAPEAIIDNHIVLHPPTTA